MPEDVLYRIEIKELPAQELAVITERVPTSQLAAWLRDAFDELFAAAAEVGAGPPFAVLPPPDSEDVVDVEAALPIAREVVPSGRIALRHDPGFRALVALHRGAYESCRRCIAPCGTRSRRRTSSRAVHHARSI